MSNSPYIIDVTAESFNFDVVQKSAETPVVVDFWAEWCAPCKQLLPVFEKLVEEYAGRFILAKVNADEEQQLTAQLSIRSLPTVKIVVAGKVVEEFTGAKPESELRELLKRHIRDPAAELLDEAKHVLAQGDEDAALTLLTQANQMDPNNMDILADIAKLKLSQGKFDEARQILVSLPADIQGQPQVKQMQARLRFFDKGGDLEVVSALEQRLKDNPQDSEAQFQLSLHAILRDDFDVAVSGLITLMQNDRDYEEDVARKTLIELFDMLGAAHPLVRDYRRKLYALLH